MVNIYVLMVFYGLQGAAIEQVQFPYRSECEYAAQTINAEVDGAKAFCFDVRVAGDRHEESFTQQQN
jgi:hypothetical protein